MDKEQRQGLEAQTDEQLAASGASAAMQSASASREAKLENEYFLNQLRRSDVDSDVYDWVSAEFPWWFSDARSVSNRGENWDQIADLSMMNERERAFASRNPGRLLKDRPFLLAVSQGADTPQADAFAQLDIPGDRQVWRRRLAKDHITQHRQPFTPEQRQAIYGSASVAADLMTLSRDGAGLEATTTISTETRVKREEQEEEAESRLGTVFE
jgi:hypothetical protein